LLLGKEDRPGEGILVLESFPMAAWKALTINPLPSKKRATEEDLRDRLEKLEGIFPLSLFGNPSHDELQAIVAGLGGIAFKNNDIQKFEIVGEPPRMVEGILREGFIVNPKKSYRNY
jgi:muconolactone delta-isomerase